MDNSPLSELPQELLDIICEYALIDDEPISLWIPEYALRPCPARPHPTGLLQTCSAMRAKAPIFYAGNAFLVGDTWRKSTSTNAERFFGVLLPCHAAAIRHLTVDFGLVAITRFMDRRIMKWYCNAYGKIMQLQEQYPLCHIRLKIDLSSNPDMCTGEIASASMDVDFRNVVESWNSSRELVANRMSALQPRERDWYSLRDAADMMQALRRRVGVEGS